MTIQERRERLNAMAKDMRNMLDNNKGDAWKTNNCQPKWDQLEGDFTTLSQEIEREEKMLNLSAQKSFDDLTKQTQDTAQNSLYQKWLRGGDNALSAADWTAVRNTMSTTTGSEGGFTVQTDVAKSIIENLKAFGGMRQVAEVFRTESGNPMNFPTSDGTSEVGEIMAQNAQASGLDVSFGTLALPVYKYGSKVIAVPIELLQDSSVDIEAFVKSRIVTRLGRITNQHFTNGTGTNQPQGIVTSSGIGKAGATGQTLTVTYDDILDLIDSVDIAYQDKPLEFMMHQQTRKVLRKLKDSAGRPLWIPSYDAGVAGKFSEQLAGNDIVLNNDMPVMAANAKSILFGDFSYYKIRDVMDINMFRFNDSVYASKGQVGFLAMMRCGGVYADLGSSVKAYQNSAT